MLIRAYLCKETKTLIPVPVKSNRMQLVRLCPFDYITRIDFFCLIEIDKLSNKHETVTMLLL